MTSKQNKTLFGVLGIIVILGFLVYSGIIDLSALSVLSVSKNVELGADGDVVTIVELKVTSSDLATYRITSPDGFELPDGSTVENGDNVLVTVKPTTQKCEYTLYPRTLRVAGLTIDTYYELGNPHRVQSIEVTTDKSTDKVTVNAFSGTEIKTIFASDQGGTMVVESAGAFVGGEDCPEGTYVAINDNGQPIIVDKQDYLAQTNLLDCADFDLLNCIQALDDLINRRYTTSSVDFIEFSNYQYNIKFADPATQEIKTKLEVYPSGGNFAQPVITLTTDEDFFNLERIEPASQIVKPNIKSFTCTNLYEGEKGNFRLIVENPSEYAKDSFYGNIYVNKGSVSPTDFEFNSISAGGEGMITFLYQAPSVTADSEATFEIEVCDAWGLDVECDTYTKKCGVIDKPDTPVPPNPNVCECGDGICCPSEDFATCPNDCATPVPPKPDCSDVPNSHEVDGACICDSGYVDKYDPETGVRSCEAPTDWETYILYGVLGLAVLAVGYALLAPPKKKVIFRSRRRKKK